MAVAVGSVLTGLALRMIPRGDLWLDEALSANIASLPIGEIAGALRHDGHPPLYYWLLHLWSSVSTSDWWLRGFSVLVSVAGIPLAYLAGRRLGGRRAAAGLGDRRVGVIAVALWAVLPFTVRYGSETRMYALVSTLVLAGYLLVDDLLGDHDRGEMSPSHRVTRALGLGLVAGSLLLTHYWAMWLVAATAVVAVAVLLRADTYSRRCGAVACLVALAGGLVMFLPWMPTAVYQSQHTGTPWGEVVGPFTVLVATVTAFAGGGYGELQLLSFVLVCLVALALFGVLRSREGVAVVELAGTPHPRILAEAAIGLGTLLAGAAASAVASATYATRYAAVVAPLFALCVAGGVAMARSKRVTTVVTAILCAGLAVGSLYEVQLPRTQAGAVASGIEADLETNLPAIGQRDTAIAVVCPDQLGPAVQRALTKRDVEASLVAFPDPNLDPRFVDWVDYEERNRLADPVAFVESVLDDSTSDAPVYLIANTTYRTFEGKCEQVMSALEERRGPLRRILKAEGEEGMALWATDPTP